MLDDRSDISVERIGGVDENYTPTISTTQDETVLTQVTATGTLRVVNRTDAGWEYRVTTPDSNPGHWFAAA